MTMTKSEEKEQAKTPSKDESETQNIEEKVSSIKEETPEEKLKITQDKLLRTMAEMENQRRRFEKEKDDAFEYGGFSFARESLNLIDNFDRARQSLENDEKIKDSDILKKTLGLEIEVEFIGLYEKQPLLGDVQNFLSKFEFEFVIDASPPLSAVKCLLYPIANTETI